MYSEILNDTGITIRQIQMCIAVYRLGSLAEAAKALGVSPSAISMGIRDAESSLQSELFHRGNKSMKQSEAGRVLFPRMEELLRQVGEFRNVFDSVDENARGHIIIGASSTVGCYVLPDLIATFQEKYPLLDIDLMVGNTAEMLEKLVNFTVDIAFVEGPSFRNDCELDRLWEDEMVVFAKSGSEFSKKSRVSCESFIQCPVVVERRWERHSFYIGSAFFEIWISSQTSNSCWKYGIRDTMCRKRIGNCLFVPQSDST